MEVGPRAGMLCNIAVHVTIMMMVCMWLNYCMCVALVQVMTLRQFLLTNLVFSDRGSAPHWRVNLDVIKASLDQVRGFPHFREPFQGPALFIGGSRSHYISYVPVKP